MSALEGAARDCWNELNACEGSQPRRIWPRAGLSPKGNLVIELLSAITHMEEMQNSLREVLEARLGLEETKLESQAGRAAQLRRLLPPAAEVAALLQRYFELPEQEAARALELAQAAGGRSCAYLWCANLAMEGREAEGKPTQKCGQCRPVRYCSRACSVEDWRAGHKRVCKALAAARDM